MDLIRKEYRLRCKTPVELVPFEDQIGGFDEPHETPVLTDDLALLVAIALNSQQKVADAFGVSHVTIFNRSKKARARVEACV